MPQLLRTRHWRAAGWCGPDFVRWSFMRLYRAQDLSRGCRSAGATVTSRLDWGWRITHKLILGQGEGWLLAGLGSWLAVRQKFQFLAVAASPWSCLGCGSWLLPKGEIGGRKERERETLIQKALSNPSSDILLLSAIGPTDEPWYGVGGAHTKG